MEVETFDLPGPVLLRPRRYTDSRGWFAETFRADRFGDALGGEAPDFVQDNESHSERAGTVRGLHYQRAPHAQGKLVRCVSGAVTDVAVDARAGSPTYGQHVAVRLDARGGAQLWVPPGFLHGFVTLAPDTRVAYKCTALYAPDAEGSVRWDDPALGIDWGLEGAPAHLSDKDAAAPAFEALRPL